MKPILFSKPILFAMLSTLAFLACKITERQPRPAPAGFDWQAHRGCRGLMPENSIPAFLKGLEYPEVVTLELDLAISKDQQVMVSHEPWFNPAICLLPGGDSIPKRDAERYLIFEKTAAEIQGFDCGSIGNPRFPQQNKQKTYKPTLSEVVKAVKEKFPNRKVRWNIEIKSEPEWDGIRTPPIAAFVNLTLTEIRQLGIANDCTIQSFDIRPLQIIHQQAPEITLAYLIENAQSFDSNIKKLGFTPHIYSPYYLLVSKKLVRKCHHSSIQLIPWTVNDIPAMRRLIGLGVDGIITDYPNLISEAIGSPKK